MNHDVRSLQVFMEARFDGIERRTDDRFDALEQRMENVRSDQFRMHAENRTDLSVISAGVAKTNGRVTALEEQIKELFRRTKDMVTQPSIKWYLALVATTAVAIYGVMRAVGYHL